MENNVREIQPNDKTQQQKKDKNKGWEEKIRYQRDKDRELVKGKFIFHEVPGGCLEFNFGAYKGDPIEFYSLRDGQVYTLPLGVARHLNKNCWYPEYEYIKSDEMAGGHGPYGKNTMRVGKKVRRCSFQSLEFVDTDDLTPVGNSSIVTVENINNEI